MSPDVNHTLYDNRAVARANTTLDRNGCGPGLIKVQLRTVRIKSKVVSTRVVWRQIRDEDIVWTNSCNGARQADFGVALVDASTPVRAHCNLEGAGHSDGFRALNDERIMEELNEPQLTFAPNLVVGCQAAPSA